MFLKKPKIEQPHYWDKRFLSSFSSLPSTLSLPGPPPPPSLLLCVKASEAVLASLDLCGSGWEDAAAIRPAVCSALIELPGLEGFFCRELEFSGLICSRSFVIKSFQASCLLVWMLNYWRGGAWLLEELCSLMPSLELTYHLGSLWLPGRIPYISHFRMKNRHLRLYLTILSVCAQIISLVPW